MIERVRAGGRIGVREQGWGKRPRELAPERMRAGALLIGLLCLLVLVEACAAGIGCPDAAGSAAPRQ